VEDSPYTFECMSSNGFVVRLVLTLIIFYLYLAWTQVVHIESSFVYPSIRDRRAVGLMWARRSVSNGSNPLERFRVRVGTGPELLQWVLPHENPDRCNWAGFTSKNPEFQRHIFSSN